MSSVRSLVASVALVLVIGLTAGCEGLLDVEPTEAVEEDAATGTVEGVQSLLAGVYNRMQHPDKYGNHLYLVPDILADVARPSEPPQQFQAEYLNQIGAHLSGWGTRYQTINEANIVIDATESLEADPSTLDRIRGEALFLRALNYFDLARMYAYEPGRAVNGWDTGIVLRSEPTTTAADADFEARSTVQETYEFIEGDLVEAIDLLGSAGRGDVYFANEAAAQALLARVYLYWERWDDAVTYATRALGNTSARLAQPDEVAAMFDQQPNPESLFELAYDPATETIYVNECMSCYTQPDGTWFSVWPTDELLALFAPEDARTALYPSTSDEVRYNDKWTASDGDFTDHKPIVRYSEVLLVRAEAYAETGQEGLARSDLTTLREARGLEPATESGDALIEAILEERRRELAFEGHRWFDLKRRARDIPKPAHSGQSPLPYDDFRILAPLPTSQVQNNPELEQNPGY